LFFEYSEDKEIEISEWRESKGLFEKNFKINFAGVMNNATFAVPRKTGNIKPSEKRDALSDTR
jgi:hypothetical protein